MLLCLFNKSYSVFASNMSEKNPAYGANRENEETAGAKVESWRRHVAQAGHAALD